MLHIVLAGYSASFGFHKVVEVCLLWLIGVERATDGIDAAMNDVGVDHRRRDVRVPEELLEAPYRAPLLEHMSREAMAERVTATALRHSGGADRLFHGALHHRLAETMPP